ncbi:regulator of nonsense transcripts 3A-like [Amphibalanus amphitrite]|uniref:regulator of nonsense transcripts 3A-like n=1 Tax=Amphibalanus amphitrite TaxID=1232801 RepID=UPI001C91392B|nr:regulator of nonsense transcripts 3A-like [Amphibalanus amphitrite]XP_043243776.1 regulator of nonsense transcripts 3A-like [Amphibalanus amphitrite]XP_043243777.1 regulator of nonsense transcripts 3A-like [Amphibalanus amphitrite]XP_043243778.1 regulator of nonsense transcripts 3A-like [Amphibalanus amphitrite]XP_043243780.1 regulator of nonsense transcripts 3A-like [Amphibalanus amphitrite]XP_043243781.1 regulator of nonsense transcripts 3A-like [Amphibalanus amphitrite]XP_043243782.1 re
MAIKNASHGEKKSYSSSKDKNKHPPTKVVIRRLPPDMALDSFVDQVSPLPDHDYLGFVPADPGLAPHAFSRAYINFSNMDDIITFRDRFDGYVFVDKQGFEYPAVVEFAPYQRTPRRRSRKPDAKSGTIFEDADYKAFLAACEQEQSEPAAPSWEQTLEEIEKRHAELREANVVTPLVTYVCKRRAEKKEERRRRELERRKEEARRAREKLLARDKRDSREKTRYDTKETSKPASREEEKDRRRDDVPTTKKYEKYDDKQKDKYTKEYTRDKQTKEAFRPDRDDKLRRKEKDDRRKDGARERPAHKEARWKDEAPEKGRREEKSRTFSREERKKDVDWEEKKKRTEKKARTSESSSEISTASARDRQAEVKDAGSERSAETRAGGDTAQPAKSGAVKRDTPDAKKERKEARAERTKTGLKNKDRPSLAIYRPGMGKYSSRRLRERDTESPSSSVGGDEAAEEPPAPARDRPAPLPRTLVFRRSRTSNE